MRSRKRKNDNQSQTQGVITLHHMTDRTGSFPQDVGAAYTLDVAASKFTLQAFAGGLLSAFGHNPVIAIPDFAGDVHLGAGGIEQATLQMTINTTSLKVVSDMPDTDRVEVERVMQQQVLESEWYPEITYECSRISASQTGQDQYWVALNGDLTLHGVTRGQTVSARVSMNGDNLRASGSFSLLQRDYEIKLVSFAGGTLKVKDELKCSFEIVAKKRG
jgi:polyisoprenoid-binding protein YceI